MHQSSSSYQVYLCKTMFREFALGEAMVRLGDVDVTAEMLPLTVSFGETCQLAPFEKQRTRLVWSMDNMDSISIFVTGQFFIS